MLLRFDAEETRKYGLHARATASCSTRRSATTSSCASSLGGDGTILRALRRYAGTSVPVFAVNYGEVGFLATIDPDEDGDLPGAFERALAGDFEVLTLPGARAGDAGGPAGGDQRRRDPPSRGRARRRARLRDRRRGGGVGALRRPRAVDARRARRATTSPTAARCWPGAWRASWCRSSRRTR